jgi:hypothetical protein
MPPTLCVLRCWLKSSPQPLTIGLTVAVGRHCWCAAELATACWLLCSSCTHITCVESLPCWVLPVLVQSTNLSFTIVGSVLSPQYRLLDLQALPPCITLLSVSTFTLSSMVRGPG